MKKSKFQQVVLPVLIVMGVTFALLMVFDLRKKKASPKEDDSAWYIENNAYEDMITVLNAHSIDVYYDDLSSVANLVSEEEAEKITTIRLSGFSNDEDTKKTSLTLDLSGLKNYKNVTALEVTSEDVIEEDDEEYYGDIEEYYGDIEDIQLTFKNLPKDSKVKELSLKSFKFKDLSFIKQLNVEAITFVNCDFSNLSDSQYEALSGITSFSIEESCVKADLEKMMKQMPKLKSVNLGGITIKDYNLFHNLKKPELLESVSFHINDTKDVFYKMLLKPAVKIKELSIQIDDRYDLGDYEHDFTFLADIKSLEKLSIWNNGINEGWDQNIEVKPLDYSYLGALTNLKSLSLSQMLVKDISFVSSLTKLQQLDLSNNLIEDVAPLSKLTGMVKLDLACNNIEDITPISNMTSMKELSIGGNKITSIDAVKNMNELESFDASSGFYFEDDETYNAENIYNKFYGLETDENTSYYGKYYECNPKSIKDIYDGKSYIYKIEDNTSFDMWEFMSSEPNSVMNSTSGNITLHQFEEGELPWGCGKNSVTDLSPIANATKLIFLDVSGNKIKDISPIEKLTNLTFFSCMDNQITDITVLSKEKFTKLTHLYLSQNKIADGTRIEEFEEGRHDNEPLQYYMTPYYNKKYFHLVEPRESYAHLEIMGFDFSGILANIGTREEEDVDNGTEY